MFVRGLLAWDEAAAGWAAAEMTSTKTCWRKLDLSSSAAFENLSDGVASRLVG